MDYHRQHKKTPDMIYIKCDYCNSDDYKVILKSKDYFFNKIEGEFTIVKCNNCNLTFTNPRLIDTELKKQYSEILNYDNRPSDTNTKNRFNIFLRKDILIDYFNYPYGKKKKIRKLIQYPNFLRVIRKLKKTQHIPTYIKKDGKVLEIGCSYGFFLAQLKKLGWDVKGIELSKNAVDYAVKKLNLSVECISIEDFESKELFNIIYMHMVLEHLESPKKILKKCYSLLKSKGKLVLIIPDFSGLEVRIYKKYAYTLQLPIHLYHFTPKSIKDYLKELNYKNIKIFHRNSDRDLLVPLSFIIRDYPDKILVKYLFKLATKRFIRKIFVKFLVDIIAFLGKTSRMTVIATK